LKICDHNIDPWFQLDPKEVLEILEGACFEDASEANPLLSILLVKILIRLYIHLWSFEAGSEAEGSVDLPV
jgi:hypothetical protein